MSFSNLGLCAELLRAIKEEGYTTQHQFNQNQFQLFYQKRCFSRCSNRDWKNGWDFTSSITKIKTAYNKDKNLMLEL